MVVVAAATACAQNNPAAPLDRAFALRVGENVTIRGVGLMVEFVRVAEDSRCPASVMCVWEGNARIELDARIGGSTQRVSLNTRQGARDVLVGAFRISLDSLAPWPQTPGAIPATQYRATLTVSEPGAICTQEARPALQVELRDKVTGASSGFTDVVVVARDGAYADSVVHAVYPPPHETSIALAYERAGTYSLSVRASGYQAWERTGIVVDADRCHVVTQAFTALLER
jgi:hypothetical protein